MTEEPVPVPVPEQELRVSEEAITFLNSIEPSELQMCVFSESLVTEAGEDQGTIDVTVQFSQRAQEPCVMVRAQKGGTVDGAPYGSTVTAFLTVEMEVLEEEYHEFIKREDHSVDKRYHVEQRLDEVVFNKFTATGEEVTTEAGSFPPSLLRGLVTEGASLLLMRLFALRKNVPENIVFVSLDQQLQTIPNTYSELSLKQLEDGGKVLEVFGVQRVVHHLEGLPTTWQCYFLDDGHLVRGVQEGPEVTVRLLQQPPQTEKRSETKSLEWEEDMEMWSGFLSRRDELQGDHASFLRQHPEIRAFVSDFFQFLLLRKPGDVYQFAKEYFRHFASGPLREPSPKSDLPEHAFEDT